MSEYLLGVIGTILLCALLSAVVPSGKTSAIIKAVAKLACTLAIVAPVLRYFTSGNVDSPISSEIFQETGIEKETAFIQYYSEMRIRQAERDLEACLKSELGVEAEILLAWKLSELSAGKYAAQEIFVERISVYPTETLSEEKQREVLAYLTKNYDSEVWIA